MVVSSVYAPTQDCDREKIVTSRYPSQRFRQEAKYMKDGYLSYLAKNFHHLEGRHTDDDRR